MVQWHHGEVVTRREINWGKPAIAWPVVVVSDEPDLLVTFTPTDAPFAYCANPYSSLRPRHPWWPKNRWEGHGVLMLQRPDDAYSVWHFWTGPDRDFECWYINLQDPFMRTPIGFDTEDHELDIVIDVSGEWHFKDVELLDERICEGRYSSLGGAAIKTQGQQLAEMIDAGDTWWDPHWAQWSPPGNWTTPSEVEPGWDLVPWKPSTVH